MSDKFEFNNFVLYQYLYDKGFSPGVNTYMEKVYDSIIELSGIDLAKNNSSEFKSKIEEISSQFSKNIRKKWNEKRFRKTRKSFEAFYNQPGRFLTMSFHVPLSMKKRKPASPPPARPVLISKGKGRPRIKFSEKHRRNKDRDATKVKTFAEGDADLVLWTANSMAKRDQGYVMRQMSMDPTLAKKLKESIKDIKKGRGNYTNYSIFYIYMRI